MLNVSFKFITFFQRTIIPLNEAYVVRHPSLLADDDELKFDITITNLTLDDNFNIQFNLYNDTGVKTLLYTTDLIVLGKSKYFRLFILI